MDLTHFALGINTQVLNDYKLFNNHSSLTYFLILFYKIFQLFRLYFLLNSAMKMSKTTQVKNQQKDCYHRLENDAFTLNLFTSLLVFVPQIILQVYIMAMLQQITFWTSK